MRAIFGARSAASERVDGGNALTSEDYCTYAGTDPFSLEYDGQGLATTNLYVYHGWQVIAVLDGTGALLERYSHGPDLSGTLGGAGGIGGILSWTPVGSGSPQCYHADALGNVMSTTDAEGDAVAHLVFSPFGEVLIQQGSASPRYQFSSKELDASVGLNYYGHRFYSPALGRWLNRDPLGDVFLFEQHISEGFESWLREMPTLWIFQPNYLALLNDPVGAIDSDGFMGKKMPTIRPPKPRPTPGGNPMKPEDPAILAACLECARLRAQLTECELHNLDCDVAGEPEKKRDCQPIADAKAKACDLCAKMSQVKGYE